MANSCMNPCTTLASLHYIPSCIKFFMELVVSLHIIWQEWIIFCAEMTMNAIVFAVVTALNSTNFCSLVQNYVTAYK